MFLSVAAIKPCLRRLRGKGEIRSHVRERRVTASSSRARASSRNGKTTDVPLKYYPRKRDNVPPHRSRGNLGMPRVKFQRDDGIGNWINGVA